MAREELTNRKSYLKDKKITILEETESGLMPNDNKWQPIEHGKNIWAYYRQASAKEVNESTMAGTEVEAVFRINWRDNVKESHRIKFRGDEYKIIRVDDFEGYKRDLTIYAKHHK